MCANYIKQTANIMETLPVYKQSKVYDYAKLIKKKEQATTKRNQKKTAIFDLFSIGESGCSDISLNHDKYLYK